MLYNILTNEILEKYNAEVFRNLNEENIKKIIEYLKTEQVYYIDELLEDYLDLFTIPFSDFVFAFQSLKEKYGFNIVYKIGENMELLEEIWEYYK